MPRRVAILAAAAALFAVPAGPAQAHHSYAGFDRAEQAVLEGEVTRITWTNPHVIVGLRTADGTDYEVVWQPVGRLARSGVRADRLAIGDRLTIRGALHKDPAVHQMTLLTEVRRASDGWSWERRGPFARGPR